MPILPTVLMMAALVNDAPPQLSAPEILERMMQADAARLDQPIEIGSQLLFGRWISAISERRVELNQSSLIAQPSR